MKKFLFLAIFLMLVLSLYPVSAQSLYRASIDVNPLGVAAPPKVGERIQITVHIQNTGTVTLNGFVVKYKFLKPSGAYTSLGSVSYSDVLSPGADVYKTINTDVVADEAGVWTVFVYLYTSNGQTLLSTDSGVFDVSQPSPQATITITNIGGYALVGGLAALLVYALTRRG